MTKLNLNVLEINNGFASLEVNEGDFRHCVQCRPDSLCNKIELLVAAGSTHIVVKMKNDLAANVRIYSITDSDKAWSEHKCL